MNQFKEIKKELSRIQALERELHLKQLQINQLLNITQAINNNIPANGLYDMYKSFLGWEIGVTKMALYIQEEDNWICTSSIGLKEDLLRLEIGDYLTKYTRLKNVEDHDHPLIKEFDVVIPVRHKEQAIAYVFIGGFSDDDDMYNKVQFITTITNIIAVAIENKRLFKRQIEQERLKRELELASEMQRMLVPKNLPKNEKYELASIYQPHLVVGGDYFDVKEFGDGKIAFCVGDISGKGLAAALLMANFQANFNALIKERTPLDEFVRDLNKVFTEITAGEKFITFFVAEYDAYSRELNYVNAGHNPPVFVSSDDIRFLDKGSTILGSFEKLPRVEVGKVSVYGNAMIHIYTDGLTDIRNAEGAYLGENFVYNFVKQNYLLSATEFNDLLVNELKSIIGEREYPDDFTALTCRIYG